MIDPYVLRQVIRISLTPLATSSTALYSADAEEILMMIAAHESGLGRTYTQAGRGPALGIYQIEPSTLTDNYINFLKWRPALATRVAEVSGVDGIDLDHLKANLIYGTIHARIKLYRSPDKLPSSSDVAGMAEYAKKYFNSNLGSATPGKYADAYERLVLKGH